MRINARPFETSRDATGTATFAAAHVGPAEIPSVTEGDLRYQECTAARYHLALGRLAKLRSRYAVLLTSMVLASGLLFFTAHRPVTPLGAELEWLTIAWLLPVPLLILSTLVYFGWFSVDRFALRPPKAAPAGPRPKVIFQITSTGLNVATVLNTARSVLYWTGQHLEVGFDPEVWLVVEGWGYAPNRARLDPLVNEGVRIVVVPTEYRTRKGTTRKGRALQWATEYRRSLGLDLTRLWIYHQDDETAVGEDTILGVDEFVTEHAATPCIGCGIILYSQGA